MQRLNGPLRSQYDLLPVPLIDKYRVYIVGILIAPYGIHIGIKSFARCKAVLFQSIALPLRKRMDHLIAAVAVLDIKRHRAFDAVKVVVESGSGVNKNGSRHAAEVELVGKVGLEEIFDLFYCDLCLTRRQTRLITIGKNECHFRCTSD